MVEDKNALFVALPSASDQRRATVQKLIGPERLMRQWLEEKQFGSMFSH
jgi:hypothetical protein